MDEDHLDDGFLRQQLSSFQYPLLLDLMRYLDGTGEAPCFAKDVESSSYSRFNALKVSCSADISILTLSRQLRASSPFPGLALIIEGRTYKVTK